MGRSRKRLPADERFLTPEDVCNMLSIQRSRLTKLVKRGQFPEPYKITQIIQRWRLSELEDFLMETKNDKENEPE